MMLFDPHLVTISQPHHLHALAIFHHTTVVQAMVYTPIINSTTTASEHRQIRRKRLDFLVSSGSVMVLQSRGNGGNSSRQLRCNQSTSHLICAIRTFDRSLPVTLANVRVSKIRWERDPPSSLEFKLYI